MLTTVCMHVLSALKKILITHRILYETAEPQQICDSLFSNRISMNFKSNLLVINWNRRDSIAF